jgi:glutathione-specific gamma-glutamylcyclotransferase
MMQAVIAPGDVVWVFGYGSLIWRPALAYVARRAARIDGWERRFWQASTDHRGTVEAPGRVLTLVESDGAVWGMAYAIARAAWPEVEAALELREQQGYARLTVELGLAAGQAAGPVVETVAGLLYVATPANPYFVGPEPLDATAEVVLRSHGPSGSNVDYVLELDRTLAAMSVADPEVSALAGRLRAARRAS